MLPSGTSRLSLPHSHAKTQPAGALAGMGGMLGFWMSGRRWVSFKKAPRPAHEVKSWLVKGAQMTPMRGLLLWMKPMLVQKVGKRWM